MDLSVGLVYGLIELVKVYFVQLFFFFLLGVVFTLIIINAGMEIIKYERPTKFEEEIKLNKEDRRRRRDERYDLRTRNDLDSVLGRKLVSRVTKEVIKELRRRK